MKEVVRAGKVVAEQLILSKTVVTKGGLQDNCLVGV